MRRRLIVQMGMGIADTAGQAAERALADAQARARLHLEVDCEVVVTLGVPEPSALDASGLNRTFGAGDIDLRVVAGGMTVAQPVGGTLIVASAAIEVFPLG